ncbi:MAG: HEPN domain-containing protein [Nanoarchaeota archaeon]
MRNKNYLFELRRKRVIELVEPSNELEESYKEKSKSNLESAHILLERGKLEEAVSLTYFSMYNMLLALLFRTGIKSESHTASIVLLKEIYNLSDEEILFAKEERKDKQYYVGFFVTKEQVQEMFKIASSFNANVTNTMAKLTNESIKSHRNKFETLVKGWEKDEKKVFIVGDYGPEHYVIKSVHKTKESALRAWNKHRLEMLKDAKESLERSKKDHISIKDMYEEMVKNLSNEDPEKIDNGAQDTPFLEEHMVEE